MAASTPMITTTIISSTRVKPEAERCRARMPPFFREIAASSIAGTRRAIADPVGDPVEDRDDLDVERLRHEVDRLRARQPKPRRDDAASVARQGLRIARHV